MSEPSQSGLSPDQAYLDEDLNKTEVNADALATNLENTQLSDKNELKNAGEAYKLFYD